MAKLFCVVNMENGSPDFSYLPLAGYVLAAQVGQSWGMYIVSGTPAELQDINALPNVYGICAVTEGSVKWAELDNTISSAVRTRLNNWLAARGYPNIPAGWTYRQVVLAVFKRVNPSYTLDGTDILE